MSNQTNGMPGTSGAGALGGLPRVILEARPERRLIRPTGSFRHVDFAVRVGQVPSGVGSDRYPLALALVLDRSGSMAGGKLETAKRAALAVLDRLDERDRVAVVVFDQAIDIVQPAAPATPIVKARIRAELATIGPRGSTALHEGWLTGCRAIADDHPLPTRGTVARCFLLTDGQANVGVTDPEQIAIEAAGIRAHAAIGTSTFGIGADYDERLLEPLAVAGGGQFYHLRRISEIAHTFVGELGDLLAVAARQARLELEADPGITIDVVSQYWTQAASGGGGTPRWTITIGDLIGGEERHIVIRCGFPRQRRPEAEALTIRGRLVWSAGGLDQTTDWQEVRFTFASNQACDDEPRDPAVMHWVGLHHSDRARREATEQSRRGDLGGARTTLRSVSRRIQEYAASDPALQEALHDLAQVEQQVSAAPASPLVAKEQWYQAHRRSRGKLDRRDGDPDPRSDASE